VSLDDGAGRRNVRLLSSCFALSTTGNVVLVSVSALVGYELADDKSLATLPAALMWIGTALATVPASFLMRRVGRRFGFMTGAVIGMCGAALGALAVTL
jgi:MFS family permease